MGSVPEFGYACRNIPTGDVVTTQTNAMRALAAVTGLNVLVASGFAIAGLVDPGLVVPVADAANQASKVFAFYAAARTIPIAIFAFGAILYRSTAALFILGSLAGAIQILDAGAGLMQHDIGKTIGPIVLALLQAAALLWFKRTSDTQRP
jgi:hypothetical protein